jgi:hypothetical protein
VFLLGHLGLTLLAGRLWAPITRDGSVPLTWLVAGGFLPDLIDKPLGHVLLSWGNGRLWAHTLWLGLLLAGLAALLASRRLAAVGLGTLVHQIGDQAWLDLSSWLWPLAGSFPRQVSTGGPHWVQMLVTDPFVWATEAAGLLVFVALLGLPLLGLAPRWWRPDPEGSTRPTGEAEVGG